MNKPTIRQPTVFLPIAMSLIALSTMLIHFALFRIVHESDEGTAAHIFQILMVAQIPIVALFAMKWSPRTTSDSEVTCFTRWFCAASNLSCLVVNVASWVN